MCVLYNINEVCLQLKLDNTTDVRSGYLTAKSPRR